MKYTLGRENCKQILENFFKNFHQAILAAPGIEKISCSTWNNPVRESQLSQNPVYLDNSSLTVALMSDILRDFNENEIKVFKCFVNPKYPGATRTLSAVVKESGLDEADILKIYATYDNLLFTPVSGNKWCFNVAFFAKKFATKYPDVFSKFTVLATPLGVIVVPKDVKPHLLATIITKISSEMDLTQPGVAEALEALNRMLAKRNNEAQTGDEISFSV